MTTKLEQAALALLAHWDTPAWRYLKPTGDLMADLREALAEQVVCKECVAKQAQIDRLMLEYCPDEMTTEQMQEWGNNQRPAEQAEQEPVGVVTKESLDGVVKWNGWIPREGTKLYAAPVEPVKQEPVAWMDLHKELGKLRWMGGDEGWDNAINAVRDRLIELATPHPVRTKDHCNPLQDLTDDEIEEIRIGIVAYEPTGYGRVFARAVIAADREKNK